MTYLLDTDICSFLMKRTDPGLIRRVRRFAPGALKVSAISVCELEFGARRTDRYHEIMRVIGAFLRNVDILPFDVDAARHAGSIRAELTDAGSLIGAYDLLIAGHARASGCTLVTNNLREFSLVADLAVENWSGTR